MRLPSWSVVVGLITWLAATVLAQPPPGGGPYGAQRPPQRGCAVSWHTFAAIGGLLVVCFIAGAVSKIRKGRAK